MYIKSRSLDETIRLGEIIGKRLFPGDVIVLTGDLGAGKTTFVRGVARSLGVSFKVKSPTFTIVHVYPGKYELNHIDAYRLSLRELLDIGINEIISGEGICVIEWGEKLENILPKERLEIDFRFAGVSERDIFINAFGEGWQKRIKGIKEELKS